MEKKPIVSVTYENERISIKKQLTLDKVCVTSLLCIPWADLWPFNTVMYRSNRSFNIPPRANPRAFDFFENYCSNSSLHCPKCRSNAPH